MKSIKSFYISLVTYVLGVCLLIIGIISFFIFKCYLKDFAFSIAFVSLLLVATIITISSLVFLVRTGKYYDECKKEENDIYKEINEQYLKMSLGIESSEKETNK